MKFSDYFANVLPIDVTELQKPLDKKWKSLAAHTGPDRQTPLRASLEGKTSNGLTLLMSASLVWAAMRLRPFVATKEIEDLAEALFLFQQSHHYLKYGEMDQFMPTTEGLGLAEGVVTSLPFLFFNEYFDFPDDRFLYPPVICCAEIIFMTKYVMPKTGKPFDSWTKEAFRRLDEIAPLTDPRMERFSYDATIEEMQIESERIAGEPLGPSALNLNSPFDPIANKIEIAKLLEWADPSRNRFLNDPETMQANGFEGLAYQLTS